MEPPATSSTTAEADGADAAGSSRPKARKFRRPPPASIQDWLEVSDSAPAPAPALNATLAETVAPKEEARIVKLNEKLTDAAWNGKLAAIKGLLADGAMASCVVQRSASKATDVSETLEVKTTPLHMAAQNGHAECVEALLEAHADVDACPWRGMTALYIASQHNCDGVVSVLLSANASVGTTEASKGFSPLMIACEYEAVACVRLILAAKAQVDKPNTLGETSLMIACAGAYSAATAAGMPTIHDGEETDGSKSIECAALLLEAGASVNRTDESRDWTALHRACKVRVADCWSSASTGSTSHLSRSHLPRSHLPRCSHRRFTPAAFTPAALLTPAAHTCRAAHTGCSHLSRSHLSRCSHLSRSHMSRAPRSRRLLMGV